MNTQVILTVENAPNVGAVLCIANPEWGAKRFNYNEQPLNDGKACSTVGVGCNSSVLFEHEYHLWAVATWKDGSPATTDKQAAPILAHLTEAARRAHYWTSFAPDRRGEQFINTYGEQLSADLETLAGYGATDEQKARYQAGYEKMIKAWLNAKSNCASTMITGGSGFNVRRAEKMNGREETHGKAFFAWRDKVLNAWKREAERRAHNAKAEAAGGEAGLMRQKLAEARAAHEKAKAGNKIIAKARAEGKDISEWLKTEFDIPAHMIDWAMRWGVTSATATANIRRMEQRVKELEAKEAQATEAPQTVAAKGEGWELVQNNEIDRFQFLFDSKPDEATRNILKSRGYKWAPSQNAWQRQITGNAVYATREIIKQLQAVAA